MAGRGRVPPPGPSLCNRAVSGSVRYRDTHCGILWADQVYTGYRETECDTDRVYREQRRISICQFKRMLQDKRI